MFRNDWHASNAIKIIQKSCEKNTRAKKREREAIQQQGTTQENCKNIQEKHEKNTGRPAAPPELSFFLVFLLGRACSKNVKSRARAAVPFSLEPKRSCANCVWLLSRLRTAALLKRIPFYNTAKQWRTLQKLALTSVDPSNTKFSFPSSLASLRQQQKALALTSPRRAKARVGVNSCKAFKACSEQHALLQGCSKASAQKTYAKLGCISLTKQR